MGNRALIDFDNKTTAFLDDTGGATIVHPTEDTVSITAAGEAINPATKQPLTLVPGYVSELATMLTGKQPVDTRKDPTYADGAAAQKLPFIAGKHYDLNPGEYIFERVSDQDAGNIAIHVKHAGKLKVSLAGTKSGAVRGGAATALGNRDADKNADGKQSNVMDGNLDSYGYTADVTDTLNQFLRLDAGGDKDVHFRVQKV